MKIDFLHSDEGNTRLILIFSGWSAGPETGYDVAMDGWDVAVVHDFTELELDTSFLDRYYTVYLFAWSLGVFAAEILLPSDRITSAFAINGTGRPISDTKGIPVDVYEGTESLLDERNLMKFRMRMTGDRQSFNKMTAEREKLGATDDISNLRKQLRNIKHRQEMESGDRSAQLPWVRVYLSRNDRIFPFENMKLYWSGEPETEIVEMEAAHYVPMQNIVRSVIADTAKVSRRFAKANISYDTHAIAQYAAAIKLASMLQESNPREGGKVLEIGCGTGLFTREYASKLKPTEATFVDITEIGPFGIAEQEEYIIEDAERWLEKQTRKWDYIVSASAIQWFADIPRFLRVCSQHLNPGGILAISTFTPGNMEELDTLRPSPIIYPSAAQLREWLEKDYEDVEVIEDEIKVEFQSVRDMLMHLKHTGVGGSAPGSGLTIRDMSHLRTLTYRPVYLRARRAHTLN